MALQLVDALIFYGGDLIGFGYAGLKTFEAVQQPKNEDLDSKWLVYWIMFSAFYVAEFFLTPILSIILLGQYHYVRFMFLMYLTLGGGAGALYHQHVRPQLEKHLPQVLDSGNKPGAGLNKFATYGK
eukprot:TRINITY_DN6722_c3_g1_i1.p2 TRINITY_DN6722_c3_g1~~TRINITY_DN6722_c3_g1_i1.p2  ORF type:complete len:148 (+),score=55.45 TRINITY_DN6722_c3_g1_i1:64-444(+)